MEEYKGIFYNDNSEKIYYEGGAHFKYKDLVRELSFIKKQREPQMSSFSSVSTKDIKGNLSLKKSLIIQKMPNIRENSMGRNIYQKKNNTKKIIFKKNIRNNHYERMPLINNRNNSLQTNSHVNQIKNLNKDYFSPLNIYSHKRNKSIEQVPNMKSSSLKRLVPISNRNQMSNNVKQKSYFFNGFNQKFITRNLKVIGKSNSTVRKNIDNPNQIKLL